MTHSHTRQNGDATSPDAAAAFTATFAFSFLHKLIHVLFLVGEENLTFHLTKIIPFKNLISSQISFHSLMPKHFNFTEAEENLLFTHTHTRFTKTGKYLKLSPGEHTTGDDGASKWS